MISIGNLTMIVRSSYFVSTFFIFVSILFVLFAAQDANPYSHLQCRDPVFGGGHHDIRERKFLVINGLGGGIGNYLIFYPAAFYFAALTGRDILILDYSLIGEMCTIIHCGFPLYSEAQAAYPAILPENYGEIRAMKTMNFQEHIWRQNLIEDNVIIAAGFQFKSGWYGDHEFANQCIDKLTGCRTYDISCQDRYALERLVVGPFHSAFRNPDMEDLYHIAGIPQNLKKGILGLPHTMAPRIDAAVHLRCQFSHFEWVVGPDDAQWADYVKEVDDFLNSKQYNAGIQLFQAIEAKIVEQLSEIKRLRDQHKRIRRRKLLTEAREYLKKKGVSLERKGRSLQKIQNVTDGKRKNRRYLEETEEEEQPEILIHHKLSFDEKIEREKYLGDGQHDRVFVYISSDNDRVKEAFAQYLEDHDHIAVIRVKTDQLIQHAKYVQHLSQNGSVGAFNLVTDWYCLSLANVLFAWRRDTGMLSTFAQSASCLSGNSQNIAIELKNGTTIVNTNKVLKLEKVKGFQLVTKNGLGWNEF